MGISQENGTRDKGNPSLRLKNGFAQDDSGPKRVAAIFRLSHNNFFTFFDNPRDSRPTGPCPSGVTFDHMFFAPAIVPKVE